MQEVPGPEFQLLAVSGAFGEQLRDTAAGDGGCRHKPIPCMVGCSAQQGSPEAPIGKPNPAQFTCQKLEGTKNNPTRASPGCSSGPPQPPPAPNPTCINANTPGKATGVWNSPVPTGSRKPFIPSMPLRDPVTQSCPLGFQRGLPLPMGEPGFSRWLLQINGLKNEQLLGNTLGTALGGSVGQGGDYPVNSALSHPPGPHRNNETNTEAQSLKGK